MAQWAPGIDTTQIEAAYRPNVDLEVGFVSRICRLPADERKLLEQAAAQNFKRLVARYWGGARPSQTDEADEEAGNPGDIVRQCLDRSLTELAWPPERLAGYRQELAERAKDRKYACLRMLVAHLDDQLVLTSQQRKRLAAALDAGWQAGWEDYFDSMYFEGVLQELPRDLPQGILRPAQRALWKEMLEASSEGVDDQIIAELVTSSSVSVSDLRRLLRAQLAARIADAAAACGLTEAQQAKLSLAGSGDIHRRLGPLEALLHKLKRAGSDVEVEQVYQVAQEVHLEPNCPSVTFGRSSLFAKVLKHLLNEQQARRYAGRIAARRKYRHQALVAWTVHNFETQMSLTASERRALQKIWLKETHPPKSVGSEEAVYLKFMTELAKIPDATTKEVLDESLWPSFGQYLAEIRMEAGALAAAEIEAH